MKHSDILGEGVLFLFGAVTAILSAQMPIGTFRAAGSGLFPLCLGAILMVLSAASIVKSLWFAAEPKGKEACAVEERTSPLMVVPFLSIVVLSTLLLKTIGYGITSFLLMAGLLGILGFKRWPMNLTLSFLTAVGSYILFVYLLNIPLPKSFLGI